MKKLIIWRLLILPIGFAVECAAATFAVYILKITSKTGLIVGAAAGILAAAVLYFLAGFKNHKASIPKISLWYFLWTFGNSSKIYFTEFISNGSVSCRNYSNLFG